MTWDPIHYAASNGDLYDLTQLVDSGANVNGKEVSKGDTPLHKATYNGQEEIVKYLVEEAGADVNVKNNNNNTPLHDACRWGYTLAVECLVKNGADVEAKNDRGKTALDVARTYNNTIIVSYLEHYLEQKKKGKTSENSALEQQEEDCEERTTVIFEDGPIGLRLAPTVGYLACRVHAFVHAFWKTTNDEAEKIQLGHVIVKVNDATMKSYAETIEILRRGGRRVVTFRPGLPADEEDVSSSSEDTDGAVNTTDEDTEGEETKYQKRRQRSFKQQEELAQQKKELDRQDQELLSLQHEQELLWQQHEQEHGQQREPSKEQQEWIRMLEEVRKEKQELERRNQQLELEQKKRDEERRRRRAKRRKKRQQKLQKEAKQAEEAVEAVAWRIQEEAELKRLREEARKIREEAELNRIQEEAKLKSMQEEAERRRKQTESFATPYPTAPLHSPPACAIFLSHTGQDVTAAHFAGVLNGKLSHYNTFLDSETLKSGDVWERKIEVNAKGCKVFVAIMSKNYFHRFWCLHELDLALRNMGCVVVPVFLDAGVEIPNANNPLLKEQFGAILSHKNLQEDESVVLTRWLSNMTALKGIQAHRNTSIDKHWLNRYCDEVTEAVHRHCKDQKVKKKGLLRRILKRASIGW